MRPKGVLPRTRAFIELRGVEDSGRCTPRWVRCGGHDIVVFHRTYPSHLTGMVHTSSLPTNWKVRARCVLLVYAAWVLWAGFGEEVEV